MRILLTSTSFQDTPGAHHDLLNSYNFIVDNLRGPLKEAVLLDVIQQYDGLICGDDEITRAVIELGKKSKLKIISKYGIGLDKLDVKAARELGMPIENCPGVNKETVAEHVFALLLSFVKNIIPENAYLQNQKWVRMIGTDLFGKTMGIVGMGNVGKQVAIRAKAFGMSVIAYDKYVDIDFAKENNIVYKNCVNELIQNSDIISLNASLEPETKYMINVEQLANLRTGVIIINTARAGLVEENAVLIGIKKKIIRGYLTDVLDEEPMIPNHPFLNNPSIIVTPHIGSRTYDNVVRQGTMTVENLLKYLF
ncbi:NAD(P)-dependent oxidoreductase [Aquirufa nivalisilvae]